MHCHVPSNCPFCRFFVKCDFTNFLYFSADFRALCEAHIKYKNLINFYGTYVTFNFQKNLQMAFGSRKNRGSKNYTEKHRRFQQKTLGWKFQIVTASQTRIWRARNFRIFGTFQNAQFEKENVDNLLFVVFNIHGLLWINIE